MENRVTFSQTLVFGEMRHWAKSLNERITKILENKHYSDEDITLLEIYVESLDSQLDMLKNTKKCRANKENKNGV